MQIQPIDWDQVNWLYFGLLVVLVFVTSLIGSLISFRRAGLGALISAVLFGGLFVMWTYYPHHLALPNSPFRTVGGAQPSESASPQAPGQPAPAPQSAPVPPAPVKPSNPVTDITPPKQ